jgi:phosphohistidine swiveling domain-containing protein
MRVIEHGPVRGTWRVMHGPDDVIALLDSGEEGVVARIRDAGATFLAPVYHQLAAIVCSSGTLRSHVGIVSREFGLPCVMAATFATDEPTDGATVEVDCSSEQGVVRA